MTRLAFHRRRLLGAALLAAVGLDLAGEPGRRGSGRPRGRIGRARGRGCGTRCGADPATLRRAARHYACRAVGAFRAALQPARARGGQRVRRRIRSCGCRLGRVGRRCHRTNGNSGGCVPTLHHRVLRQQLRRVFRAALRGLAAGARALPNGEQVVDTRIVPRSGDPHELAYVMRETSQGLAGGGRAVGWHDEPGGGAADLISATCCCMAARRRWRRASRRSRQPVRRHGVGAFQSLCAGWYH